jgi:hypothetical protein
MGDDRGEDSSEEGKQEPVAKALAGVEMTRVHEDGVVMAGSGL